MNIDATKLLPKTFKWFYTDERYLVHKGGTRSSKTWSILQALIIYGLENKGVTISIYRAEQTVAKRTVGQDLVEILRDHMDIYDANAHHKTKAEYTLPGGSVIRLRGCDKSSRLRGEKSDILYLNEVQEINESSWTQLKIRSKRVIVDFNPSFDWNTFYLSDDVQQSDYTMITSTYKDNPFLADETIQGIESLIPVYKEQDCLVRDKDLTYNGNGRLVSGNPVDWSVYGTANYMRSPLLLLSRYTVDDFTIDEPDAYGLDFGFTSPSSLVAIKIEEKHNENDVLYVEQLLYEPGLTTNDLVRRLDSLSVNKNTALFCDSAEPDRIVQLQRSGYNAKKSHKDIKAGLDAMRSRQLIVCGDDLVHELKNYKRKNRDSDKPKSNLKDHAIDAARYATLSLVAGPKKENWNKTYNALDKLTL